MLAELCVTTSLAQSTMMVMSVRVNPSSPSSRVSAGECFFWYRRTRAGLSLDSCIGLTGVSESHAVVGISLSSHLFCLLFYSCNTSSLVATISHTVCLLISNACMVCVCVTEKRLCNGMMFVRLSVPFVCVGTLWWVCCCGPGR